MFCYCFQESQPNKGKAQTRTTNFQNDGSRLKYTSNGFNRQIKAYSKQSVSARERSHVDNGNDLIFDNDLMTENNGRGSKKQNLNHLLNFKYFSREKQFDHETKMMKQFWSTKLNKSSMFTKEQFLQAKYLRFIKLSNKDSQKILFFLLKLQIYCQYVEKLQRSLCRP